MALRPPGNVAPQVPENATAEGVHSPVDMHQVGHLAPVPCKHTGLSPCADITVGAYSRGYAIPDMSNSETPSAMELR